jgi:hypothetical protein
MVEMVGLETILEKQGFTLRDGRLMTSSKFRSVSFPKGSVIVVASRGLE